MRTTITLVNGGVALIAENPFTGDFMCEAYSIPRNGGYVRDADGNQVCAGLASRGNALTADTGEELLAIIRREWQAMRRDAASF